MGEIGGKIREGIIGFEPPTNSILVFRPQTTVQSFIKFYSKAIAMRQKTQSRAAARKPRDAAAVLFSLKFANDIDAFRRY